MKRRNWTATLLGMLLAAMPGFVLTTDTCLAADTSGQAASVIEVNAATSRPAGPSFYEAEVLRHTGGTGPFALRHSRLLQESLSVSVEGRLLDATEYALDSENGRLYLAAPISPLATVRVSYRYLSEQPGQPGMEYAIPFNSMLSVSPGLRLGPTFSMAQNDARVPLVRGSSLELRKQGFTLRGGYFSSGASPAGESSYLRQQLTQFAALDQPPGAGRSAAAPVNRGRTIPLSMDVTSGRFKATGHYWTVEPEFAAPSSPAVAQAVGSSLTAVGAPTGDLNALRGMEHVDSRAEWGLGSALSVAATYGRDENLQQGHKEFGLTRTGFTKQVTYTGLMPGATVSMADILMREYWDKADQHTGSTTRTRSVGFTQAFKTTAGPTSLGYSRTFQTSTDRASQRAVEVASTNYSLGTVELLPGLAFSGSAVKVEPESGAQSRQLNLRTERGGLHLSGKARVEGQYQENWVEGQQSTSALSLTMPEWSPTRLVTWGGGFLMAKDQSNRVMKTSLAGVQITPFRWLGMRGDFRGEEPEGGPYTVARSLGITSPLTKEFSLSGAFLRQERGNQLVAASKSVTVRQNALSKAVSTYATYGEDIAGGDSATTRSRVEYGGTLTPWPGLKVMGQYIQRDQPDNSRLVTKGWHLEAPFFSQVRLTGDYSLNPVNPQKPQEIAFAGRTSAWGLAGKVTPQMEVGAQYQETQPYAAPLQTVVNYVTTVQPIAGVKLAANYIQRDQADNDRLVTKGWHLESPFFGDLRVTGDYIMNPVDPKNGRITRFGTQQVLGLTGPLSDRVAITANHIIDLDQQKGVRVDTSRMVFTGKLGQADNIGLHLYMTKTYAPGGWDSAQGFLATYSRRLDADRLLSFCITDEPSNADFTQQRPGLSRYDPRYLGTRWYLELRNTF